MILIYWFPASTHLVYKYNINIHKHTYIYIYMFVQRYCENDPGFKILLGFDPGFNPRLAGWLELEQGTYTI